MITKDVEITKDQITLKFKDGNDIILSNEVAEKIWYAIEERKIMDFIEALVEEDDYNEIEKADIREMYIGRAESIKDTLKNHIAEAALSEFVLTGMDE